MNLFLVADDGELFEYEQIMSDDDDLPEYQYEEEFIIEEWEDWVKPFVAHDVVEFEELRYFKNPTNSSFMVDLNTYNNLGSKVENFDENLLLCNKMESLIKDTTCISNLPDSGKSSDKEDLEEQKGETWVQAVEQLCQLLPSALIYSENKEGKILLVTSYIYFMSNLFKEMMKILIEWVHHGLDLTLAMNQKQPVYKVIISISH